MGGDYSQPLKTIACRGCQQLVVYGEATAHCLVPGCQAHFCCNSLKVSNEASTPAPDSTKNSSCVPKECETCKALLCPTHWMESLNIQMDLKMTDKRCCPAARPCQMCQHSIVPARIDRWPETKTETWTIWNRWYARGFDEYKCQHCEKPCCRNCLFQYALECRDSKGLQRRCHPCCDKIDPRMIGICPAGKRCRQGSYYRHHQNYYGRRYYAQPKHANQVSIACSQCINVELCGHNRRQCSTCDRWVCAAGMMSKTIRLGDDKRACTTCFKSHVVDMLPFPVPQLRWIVIGYLGSIQALHTRRLLSGPQLCFPHTMVPPLRTQVKESLFALFAEREAKYMLREQQQTTTTSAATTASTETASVQTAVTTSPITVNQAKLDTVDKRLWDGLLQAAQNVLSAYELHQSQTNQKPS